MKEKRKWEKMRRVFAVMLIVVGFFALITPFTPGSWLALIGLGILWEKSPQEVLDVLKEKGKIITSFFKRRK